MENTVVIDMDGVLVDIASALEEFIRLTGYPCYCKDRVLTYDFNTSLDEELVPFWLKATWNRDEPNYLNVPVKNIFAAFKESRLFGMASFFDGAVSAVRELSKYRKVIIRTLASTDDIAYVKTEQLKEAFGDCGIEFSVIVGDSKPALPDAAYVIEDSLAELGKYGTRTGKLLIEATHNTEKYNPKYDFGDVIRFNSVAEAVYHILSTEK